MHYTRTGKPDIPREDQDANDALVSDALTSLTAVEAEAPDGKLLMRSCCWPLVAGQNVE